MSSPNLLDFFVLCRSRWQWLALVLLLQILVILSMPLAGDEAYFVAWGKQLSWIYYDHPPLTGWVSWVIGQLSPAGYLHRLFSLLLGLLSCLLFYRFLVLRYDSGRASHFAPLFLSTPISLLLFSLFVNDSLLFSALTLFYTASFLSLQFSGAEVSRSWYYALLGGLGLALAMLIKFTALVYFAALGVFLLLNPQWYGFLFRQFFVVGMLGFCGFLITLVANYYNCGVNFAFNFVFRESVASLSGLWQLFASLLLLLGPILLFWHPLEVIRNFRSSRYFFSGCFVVTLCLLGVIAVNRGEFGLHWAAPVVLLGLLATAEQIAAERSQLVLRWNLVYSLAVIIPLTAGLYLLGQGSPLLLKYFDEEFQYRARQINDIQNGSLLADIERRFPGMTVVTDSYGLVSMIETRSDLDTAMMFNAGSKYGRNHDIFRDYRDYDGRDLLLLGTKHNDDDGDLARRSGFFREAERVTLSGQQGDYLAVLGRGFDYAAYRDKYIKRTRKLYYDQIPALYGACYMDRYQ